MGSVLQTDVERAVRQYARMLFRTCLVMLCNEYDAEDAVQDTFVRYIRKTPVFNDAGHEKAWLITVATNICRNMRRYKLLHKPANIGDLHDYAETNEETPLLEALMTLPSKYKEVLVLHYVEGYKVDDIAHIVRISSAAVKKRLQKGRELLKNECREES